MMIPEYQLQNELLRLVFPSGIAYELPYAWESSGEDDISLRGKSEDRALSHGGVETGDGKISSKTIDLSFYLQCETRAEFQKEFGKIKALFMQEGIRLYLGNTNEYYLVSRLVKTKTKPQKGFKGRFSEITLSLRCADPFRYSENRSKKSFELGLNAESEWIDLEVDCISNIDTPVIITFKPSGALTNFSLLSVGRKESLVISDTMLTPESTMVINGENGTVYRDSSNAINTMTGTFISLDPGKNILRYKGASGLLSIEYRARWC